MSFFKNLFNSFKKEDSYYHTMLSGIIDTSPTAARVKKMKDFILGAADTHFMTCVNTPDGRETFVNHFKLLLSKDAKALFEDDAIVSCLHNNGFDDLFSHFEISGVENPIKRIEQLKQEKAEQETQRKKAEAEEAARVRKEKAEEAARLKKIKEQERHKRTTELTADIRDIMSHEKNSGHALLSLLKKLDRYDLYYVAIAMSIPNVSNLVFNCDDSYVKHKQKQISEKYPEMLYDIFKHNNPTVQSYIETDAILSMVLGQRTSLEKAKFFKLIIPPNRASISKLLDFVNNNWEDSTLKQELYSHLLTSEAMFTGYRVTNDINYLIKINDNYSISKSTYKNALVTAYELNFLDLSTKTVHFTTSNHNRYLADGYINIKYIEDTLSPLEIKDKINLLQDILNNKYPRLTEGLGREVFKTALFKAQLENNSSGLNIDKWDLTL